MGMAEPAEAGGGLTEVHHRSVRRVEQSHLPNETKQKNLIETGYIY